jgi:hypothetical protein
MNERPLIGYYVHHHGGGHAARARAIAAHLDCRVAMLSSLPARQLRDAELVPLPLDTDGGTPTAPPELHYAPLRSRGLSRRMALIAGWIAAHEPDVFVVDVSVEVAALARLCGVPVVYVRQTGRRDDAPHRLAYGWASHLLAPYPAWLEPAATPPELRRRTVHAGAITRFDGAPRPRDGAAGRPARVLAIGPRALPRAAAIAAAAPGWEVLAAVSAGPDPVPDGVRILDAARIDLDLLASCAVVVAPAGANTVAEVAFARCGLVCIPEPRPFDEQSERGRDLERIGAAAVLRSEPADRGWPELLDLALARAARLEPWADGGGAPRAARFLRRAGAQDLASSNSAASSQRISPRSASSRSHPRAGQNPQRR